MGSMEIDMNKHQKHAILALNMAKDDGVQKIKLMFESSRYLQPMLEEYKDEIDAAIDWVKRQTGE